MSTIFDLSASTPAGKPYPFDAHRGKVMLVVNTATQCGFTVQFDGLEKLHQKYKDQGLVVVGFPCDQFGHQEPLTDAEMVEACKMNHGVTFPLMAKSDVNGPATNPVFKLLKGKKRWFVPNNIGWNFTKFLVSRDGTIVRRYESKVVPADLVKDIEALL